MKLKSLYIKKYKNIKGQTFDFSNHNGITLLIGNNGSGKSNLLESISDIFSNLYQKKNLYETEGFNLEYIDNADVTYSIKYENGKLEKKVNGSIETQTNPVVLPKRVVAVYSGETARLWERFYSPIYDGLVQQINSPILSASLRLPEMIYLNHHYWDLSLLSLLCSEAEDVKSFCNSEVGISENVYFEFKYAQQEGANGYHSYSRSRILEFVKSFDSKLQYTIGEYIKCIEAAGFQRNDIFELLYCAYAPTDGKIITDIKVKFNDGLSVSDLSEGIKKRILIKAALEFAGQEDSLYLLDEPDAHIHLSKKRKIVEDLMLYNNIKHILITSHSPTMCKYVGKYNPHSIIMLDGGEKKTISNLFEAGRLMSDNDEIFNLLFTTKHLVLTEGKTDCKYIKKAIELFKNDYNVLYNDIEFISIGGTDGDIINDLLPRITDLNNRKIIVLVDRDIAGLKCAKKVLGNKNFKKENVDVKSIPTKKNAFLVMLPSKNGSQQDFVIEDYFDHDKIQELSINYINTNFSNKNFVEFPKVKDDLKKEILPKFCDDSVNPEDFIGFRVLLDKLAILLN